ncbi:hypothetical protein [Pontibacter liquoris]|uniref:hypothetical protein n=1 Tax=Pontibacter liquoris TaxID=2905677 RepID=UPI001FA77E2F|nr:hypothetical protein [Pontibacter liquoris]
MMVSKTKTSEVIFDATQVRLELQCSQSLDSADFRQVLLDALQFAGEHDIKHWLLDLREIGELTEEDETWVFTQLFPRIMITLGSENYLAILLSQSCYNRLLMEVGQQGLCSFNSFVILHNFYQLNEANAWLNSQRPQAA